MNTLFESQAPHPLADRLRPKTLADIVGQDHLLGPDGPDRPHGRGAAARLDDPVGAAGLRQDDDRPAAGARHRPRISSRCRRCSPASPICARCSRRRASGARSARARCCSSTRSTASTAPSRTRFLPYVEDGTVILVGATTENPSFELNGALLSRARSSCCAGSTTRRSRPCCARAEQHLGHAAAADRRRRAPRCARWPTATAASCSTWSRSSTGCRASRPLDAAAAGRRSCSAARRSTTRRRKATTT